MAVSNVNYINHEFSYVDKNVTLLNFMEVFTKFMVGGFDPMNIESITVTNKKARVVTSEKSFYTVPGVKLEIAGTGVSTLDTRQEVQEVFTDGFTFDTDAADGNYTNGLTYKHPGLGWSIVRQSQEQYVFKPGNSAKTEFYFVLESFFYNNRYRSYRMYITYEFDRNNRMSKFFPRKDINNVHIFPMETDTTMTTKPHNFYFYGDDAFVLVGARSGTAAEVIVDFDNNITTAFFGEAKSYLDRQSIQVISGQNYTRDRADLIGNTIGNYSCSTIFSCRNSAESIVIGQLVEDRLIIFPTSITFLRKHNNSVTPYNSGDSSYIKNNTIKGSQVKIDFLPIEVIDSGCFTITELPGVYNYNAFASYLVGRSRQDIPVQLGNKNKNCVLVKASSFQSTSNGGASMDTKFSSGLLDLTGPIR